MKKTLLLALALIAVGCSEPPDGPYESYFDNGQLQEKATLVAGERGGPFEMYHENGQLWSKASLRQVEKLGGRPLHRLHLFRRPL